MPPLTPLIRPDVYFAERELNGLRVLAVVLILTVAGPATVYGVGWIFTAHIDGSVLVDNPDRPPDAICESDTDTLDKSGCDQPRKVERDVDSIIWSAISGLTGVALVAGPFVWLLTGVLLHVGSWLGGGEDGFLSSFGVAAWGLLPDLVGIIVMLPVLYLAFDPITATPAGGPSAIDAARDHVQAVRPFGTAIALITAAWSAVIWRYGLECKRGLDGQTAWLVAGLVAALLALGALV